MLSYDKIKESAIFILNKIRVVPTIGVILGTGLSGMLDNLEETVEIPYGEIPNFPVSTVEGHLGKLIFGKMKNKYLLIMSGRFHFYEGYSMAECGFPIAVMREIGVKTLLATCAVGAINREMVPGDLVVIHDHIKLCAESPLRGENIPELGPRYNDMTFAYTPELRELTKEIAYGLAVNLKEGIYGYMSGPSFETPAEVRALEVLGADIVGMSTVPEVIVAAYCGMKVLGIAWVSNMAAGVINEHLALETSASDQFNRLIKSVIDML